MQAASIAGALKSVDNGVLFEFLEFRQRQRERLVDFAAEDQTRIVYVRGDQTISYAQLMDVLGMVNRAGFSKVSLVAEAIVSK